MNFETFIFRKTVEQFGVIYIIPLMAYSNAEIRFISKDLLCFFLFNSIPTYNGLSNAKICKCLIVIEYWLGLVSVFEDWSKFGGYFLTKASL